MRNGKFNDKKETGPTTLELLLRLEGQFRRDLEPIRVTPLQAGVILFLLRHAEARATDAATAFHLRLPTMVEVVKTLARKQWIIRRRSVTDTRVVHLSLSRRGQDIAQKIENQLRPVRIGVAISEGLTAAGLTRSPRLSAQPKDASS